MTGADSMGSSMNSTSFSADPAEAMSILVAEPARTRLPGGKLEAAKFIGGDLAGAVQEERCAGKARLARVENAVFVFVDENTARHRPHRPHDHRARCRPIHHAGRRSAPMKLLLKLN